MDNGEAFQIVVTAEDPGDRLDSVVASHLRHGSRTFAASLIKEGAVSVGGKQKKPGYRVKPGDEIHGVVPPPVETEVIPENIPLRILHEDNDIVVINKAPGIVVHPAPGHPNGTLVNALLYHCPDIQGIGGEIRPGIVHRLDMDTSGIIIVAKNDLAHVRLSEMFKDRSMEKEYLALVYGEPDADSGIILETIGRDPNDRKKMSINSRNGRPSESHWKVLQRFGGVSLMSVAIKTGRTHQIRVHMSSIDHPIVGDMVYGKRKNGKRYKKNRFFEDLFKKADRQMLHAARLAFSHPVTGSPMEITADPHDDMQAIITALENRVAASFE